MADQEDLKASAEKANAAAEEALPSKAEAEAGSEPQPAATGELPAPASTAATPALANAGEVARKPAARSRADRKPILTGGGAVAKTAPKALPNATSPVETPAEFKETTMEKTAEFTEGLEKAAADAQAKAQQAFEKSSAMFGECAEFAKGNVEALVESGKILAAGAQKLGADIVAEGKTSLETASSDVRQLAAAKSPTEFFKLQTDILRRSFDSALALTSRNGETVMKLASDSFAPISGRFALAVEKLKKAA